MVRSCFRRNHVLWKRALIALNTYGQNSKADCQPLPGAGIIGAGAYAIATTSLGLSVKATLLASSFLPLIMILSFFLILPRGPLRRTNKSSAQKHQEPRAAGITSDEDHEAREDEGLLSNPVELHSASENLSWLENFRKNLRRSRGLFFP